MDRNTSSACQNMNFLAFCLQHDSFVLVQAVDPTTGLSLQQALSNEDAVIPSVANRGSSGKVLWWQKQRAKVIIVSHTNRYIMQGL